MCSAEELVDLVVECGAIGATVPLLSFFHKQEEEDSSMETSTSSRSAQDITILLPAVCCASAYKTLPSVSMSLCPSLHASGIRPLLTGPRTLAPDLLGADSCTSGQAAWNGSPARKLEPQMQG